MTTCVSHHCVICNRTHTDAGTCPGCLATVRADLGLIATMCGYPLLEEVLSGRVESEAAAMLGPTANPEAWRNQAMSAIQGRVCKCHERGQVCPVDMPRMEGPVCVECDHLSCWLAKRSWNRMCPDATGYLVDCRDEMSPLWVLGEWEQLWRDHLDHPAPDDQVMTLTAAAAYLNTQMTYMAAQEDPPFDDFAAALKACRTHLQAVLHDQNQGDAAGVGCFECGGKLERPMKTPAQCPHRTPARKWLSVLTTYPELPIQQLERTGAKMACSDCDQGGFEDVWTCQRCLRRYTYAEYNFALRANLEAQQQEEPA